MNNSIPRRPGSWSPGSAALLGLGLACSVASFPAEEPKKPASTFPAQVLIIRHAEKPPDEDKSVHLSERGEKRARALHELFEASPGRPDPFPPPDFIFATHPSEASRRPVETVTPLAGKLKLPINDTFRNHLLEPDSAGGKDRKKGILDLSRELFSDKRYQGKTVLISWHHGTIPHLARALKAADAPRDWDHNTFDRVWQITYDDKGNTTFTDRPQRLLAGDAKK
jgi:broad specificity phosphatase PhoE